DPAQLSRSADLRGHWPEPRSRGSLLHRHRFAHRRHRAKGDRARSADVPQPRLCRTAPAAARRWRVPVSPRWREARLEPRSDPFPRMGGAHQRLEEVQAVFDPRKYEKPAPPLYPGLVGIRAAAADPDGGIRTRRIDLQAADYRRDVLWLHQQSRARDD